MSMMTETNNNHNTNNEAFHVCVIGIGSMGFGMGMALLSSNSTVTVTGYDLNTASVNSFHTESKNVNKCISSNAPQSVRDAVVRGKTNVVLLSLVNESQCEQICFEGEVSLVDLLAPGSHVIVCSTVTASWCRSASTRLETHNIHFIDCPVSGGPARAQEGDLSIMASNTHNINTIMPLLQAMGREVHVIKGSDGTDLPTTGIAGTANGVGMGSTAKMVHQLVAGVHICAAAESLALASKAGLDVDQMYDIVNGAAGCSWMFTDRGKRMIDTNENTTCKSALDIFVKDLDIVYKESKNFKSPIPLASAALQQFISGQSLGLGKRDDSQVIKVYEALNGTTALQAKSTDASSKDTSTTTDEKL